MAIGAIRHDLLVAYYHIVRDQVPFRERGPDWQRKRYSPEHRARRLRRQLEALGYKVNLKQARAGRTSRLTSQQRQPVHVGAPADSIVHAQMRSPTRGFTGQPRRAAGARAGA
jgi:hypothetical protein